MNPPSTSTASLFDFGKSRMCPTDARTVKPEPRYFSIVFALAGDSTITNFIQYFQRKLLRACRASHAERCGTGEILLLQVSYGYALISQQTSMCQARHEQRSIFD